MDELCKGSVTIQQLLIGAALRDLSFNQHQDQIGLGQEACPMGHQDASLPKVKQCKPSQKTALPAKCSGIIFRSVFEHFLPTVCYI